MCTNRKDMPQVDWEDYSDLMAFMRNCRVFISNGHMLPKKAKGFQCPDLVHIRPLEPHALSKPVLLSKEPEVLDGNHRRMAFIKFGGLMPYVMFHCPMREAIDLMFKFPKSYRYGDGHEHPFKI